MLQLEEEERADGGCGRRQRSGCGWKKKKKKMAEKPDNTASTLEAMLVQRLSFSKANDSMCSARPALFTLLEAWKAVTDDMLLTGQGLRAEPAASTPYKQPARATESRMPASCQCLLACPAAPCMSTRLFADARQQVFDALLTCLAVLLLGSDFGSAMTCSL